MRQVNFSSAKQQSRGSTTKACRRRPSVRIIRTGRAALSISRSDSDGRGGPGGGERPSSRHPVKRPVTRGSRPRTRTSRKSESEVSRARYPSPMRSKLIINILCKRLRSRTAGRIVLRPSYRQHDVYIYII